MDKGKRFNEIYDLLALRVFVDTEAECYQALGIIHSKYRPIPKRFKDYIAMPKTNMYQSLHTTVFGVDGQLFEVQIRTYEMDQIAENGIASHWSYKEKGSNTKANMQNAMEQKLQFFKAIMELKNEEQNDACFVQSVQEDVLKDNVYVFTPQGDVIELPVGSTPIDFAYKVHSGVGEKMVGAMVNGNIAPLDYILKDNDIVKINTNKNSLGPSREWMNMAKTTSARNKIKAFFNRIDKEEYLKAGEELFNKELRKKKIALADFFTDVNIEKILGEFKFPSMNELYVNIGNNKIAPSAVIHVIYNESKSKQEIILENAQEQKEVKVALAKNDILVSGIDEIKVNVASCCKPVPGDRIVGYITKGNGIAVHRMVCPNVSELEERIIEVKWNTTVSKKYPTNILVRIEKNADILLDIISKASNQDIMIKGINTMNSSSFTMFDIVVMVENKEKLLKYMNDLEGMSSILSVERIIK